MLKLGSMQNGVFKGVVVGLLVAIVGVVMVHGITLTQETSRNTAQIEGLQDLIKNQSTEIKEFRTRMRSLEITIASRDTAEVLSTGD